MDGRIVVDADGYLHANPTKSVPLEPLDAELTAPRIAVADDKHVERPLNPSAFHDAFQTKIHIKFYTNYYTETTNILECADTIWLNHSELNATLVCVTSTQNNFFDHRIEFDLGTSPPASRSRPSASSRLCLA